MAKTVGYVGTIEAETRGTHRIWFSLTEEPQGDKWVEIEGARAWFSLEMEAPDLADRPIQSALLLEAMRGGLQIQVSHGDASLQHNQPNDGFEANGVRILRAGIHFGPER